MTLYHDGKFPKGIMRPIHEAYEGTLKIDTTPPEGSKPAECKALMDAFAQRGSEIGSGNLSRKPQQKDTNQEDTPALEQRLTNFF